MIKSIKRRMARIRNGASISSKTWHGSNEAGAAVRGSRPLWGRLLRVCEFAAIGGKRKASGTDR
jgi:hypothetical protein